MVIGGATATGKTEFALRVAERLELSILNADSRQFYAEMNIGTAKPTAAELARAPHHFVGHRSVHDDYNVGNYERDALDLLETTIFPQRPIALLVGGSGLYIRAVCEGLDAFPDISTEVNERWRQLHRERGLAYLQSELARRDPLYFSTVDQQNPVRLLRALTVCEVAGRPYSSFLGQPKPERPFIPVYFHLKEHRPALYQRIDQRVERMIARGLEAEALSLYPLRHLNALQTVGYQEWYPYFAGERSRTEAIRLIKRNSRRYAKRQMTWFGNQGAFETVSFDHVEAVIGRLRNLMGSG